MSNNVYNDITEFDKNDLRDKGFTLDKKTIALIVVLGVIVIFYFQIMEALGLYSPAPPPQQKTQTEIVDSAQTDTNSYMTPETTAAETLNNISADKLPTEIPAAAASVDSFVVQDSIIIETNRYIIILSSFGGGPVSQILKGYEYRDGNKIEMLPNSEAATPETRFAGGTFSTSQLSFASNLNPGKYDVTSGQLNLTYSYLNEEGAAIQRHYTFYADNYHYDLSIELVEPHKLGLTGKYSLIWNTPLGVTEPQPQIDYDEMSALAYQGGGLEHLDDFEDDRLKQSLEGNTIWAGVRSKYFAAVMIPRSRDAEAVFATGYKNPIETDDGMVDERKITVGIDMPFANVVSLVDSFTVFVGPMEYYKMKKYDVHLEEILDIGTTPFVGWLIKIFAVPIMWILPKMYQFIPNYGLVIILFAFMVKIITLPLSMKSFKSMNAMKELQPKIEQLKKKHEKNPQQLNSETMKLYKEHGVNPISGCLPMLPQMPLFFALFAVFKSTILLRNAPFVWFIDDLSRGASSYTDPYMILVLIMVAAQFASQKVTMGGATTQQNKAFAYIMPLFMGWAFHSFASGLVLYWTCFSVFSLLDYVIFKRKNKNPQVQ